MASGIPSTSNGAAATTTAATTTTKRAFPIKVALLGPPGSGKGSQCVRIREKFSDLCYINPAMILRDEIVRQTKIGVDAQQLMLSGTVIPQDTYTSLILERARSTACKAGYILDGAPTDLAQAQALEKKGEHLDAVIFLDVDDETVMRRTSGRWVHQRSGRIYHDTLARPKQPYKDDETGEALIQRADDTPMVATERLARYKENASALASYYSAVSDAQKDSAAAKRGATKLQATPAAPPVESSTTSSPAAGDVVVYPTEPTNVLTVDAKGTMDVVRVRVFAAVESAIALKAEALRRKSQWWRFQ